MTTAELMVRARKAALVTAVGAPLVVALQTGALADQKEPPAFSVRAAAALLTDSDSRDLTGSAGLLIGLTGTIPTTSLLAAETGVPAVDLDFSRFTGDGNSLETWGLFYTERVPFAMKADKIAIKPYWGLGIGLSYVRGEFAGYEGSNGGGSNLIAPSASGSTPAYSETQWRAGAKALLGADITDDLYAELSYTLSGSVEGYATDALGLAVGVRF